MMTADTVTEEHAQNLRAQHRAARSANIRTWITHSDPTQNMATLNKIPDTLLADLYPALWGLGPRGDIYLHQLDAIEKLLDNIHQGTTDATFLTDFPTYFTGFPTLRTDQTNIDPIDHYGAAHGLPISVDHEDIPALYKHNDTSNPDRLDELCNHPVWQTHGDPYSTDFGDFLHNFSVISIYIDLMRTSTHTPYRTLARDYDTFCTRWGIPQ